MSMLPQHHPVARRPRLGWLIALPSHTLLVACAAPPPPAPAPEPTATEARATTATRPPAEVERLPAADAPVPPVQKKAGPRSQEPNVNPSDIAVRLSRGPCFGRCPIYSVAIDSGGSVTFTGERFVAAIGEHHGTADPAALAALRALLADADVRKLDGDYTPADKRCGQYATDMPMVRMEVVEGGRRRQIDHYTGCDAAPESLTRLAKAIDAAAGSQRWIDAARE